MLIKRVWCMPNKYTFQIKPIKELLARYGDEEWGEKVEIKTCPFCGFIPQIEISENWCHDKTLYTVRCKTSKCFGHPRDSVWFDSKEQAIKSWNRRKGG